MQHFFGIEQVMRMLGFSQGVVTRMFEEGTLRGFRQAGQKRVRRYHRASVLRYRLTTTLATNAIFVDRAHVYLLDDDTARSGSLARLLGADRRFAPLRVQTDPNAFEPELRKDAADLVIINTGTSGLALTTLLNSFRAQEYLRDVLVLLLHPETMGSAEEISQLPADFRASLGDSPEALVVRIVEILGFAKEV